jgi:hypothetical protein
MKRLLVGILTVLVAVGLSVSSAEAKGNKKRRGKSPKSAQIQNSMGELKWGMSKDDLLKKLTQRVKERYRPLVAKTHDAVEEDRLRQEAKDEIGKLRQGFVQFKGRSNWDISFLEGEFTHGNGESMLVRRDENSQNFYFFMKGKLWKWYKAFDADVFPAGSFEAFAGSVTRKFGKAKEISGELVKGSGQERHWLEWQDKTSRLRAIDLTGFYGFYCLVFEDKATLKNLARLRTAPQPKRGPKRHALVDSVTSGGSAEPDDSPNIVDRITGKLRKREQAPKPEGRKGKRGKRGRSSPSPAVSRDDDPLRGLGL